MARSPRDDRTVEAVRDELRREDETVRDERGEPAASDPERPDVPLGVPDDADDDERPGFPRGDPSHG
jgi:hypothetical protein